MPFVPAIEMMKELVSKPGISMPADKLTVSAPAKPMLLE